MDTNEITQQDLRALLKNHEGGSVVGTYWPRMTADYFGELPDDIEDVLKQAAAKIAEILEPGAREKVLETYSPEYIIFYHDAAREELRKTFAQTLQRMLQDDPQGYEKLRGKATSKKKRD